MNRKLTNSLSALAATGAVLVATVVFGLTPLSPDRSIDPFLAAADGPGSDDSATPPSPVSRANGTGQLTRTLAMPYFSFVPRG